MRIVCASDTHGFHRKLEVPTAEIFIHAGDFSTLASTVDEIDDFNDWLGSLPHRHKIVVSGNHDKLFETKPKLARQNLTNAVYLEHSAATIEGLLFWGCPVTPVLPHMAFATPPGAAGKYWDMIPGRTDVLITHGPPFGILDKEDILREHDGCMQLNRAVQRIRPALHIFGHIHGGRGTEKGPHGTLFVNCAVLNGDRLSPPILINLDCTSH